MSRLEANRSLHIDTLRGMACLLLVLFHVVGDTPTSGLTVPESSWLHRINEVIAYLRMPLFAFIAGYVYAYRPYQGQTLRFLKSKVVRLLLPVLTVGTVFAVLQANISGANHEIGPWWKIHLIPVGHYWFLQSLFIVFVVVALLERLKALADPVGLLAVWLVSVALFVFWSAPPQLALPGAVYLLPFFLGGLASKRFEFNARRWVLVAALALTGSALTAIVMHERWPNNALDLATVGVGLSASFLLLQTNIKNRALAFIGLYSFAIYLFHVFFTAGSRIALKRLGVADITPLLLAGMLAGVVGPMLVAFVARRYQPLNFLVLGSSARPRPA